MASPARSLVPMLRSLLSANREGDGDLLGRFVRGRDEEAFAELLSRHGPMVLGVARRVSRDAHAAEDVFQATFLLLARRAASIRRPEGLAAWLHQTAFRLSLRTRRAPSLPVLAPRVEPSALDTLTARELLGVIDDELARLPEEQRQAVVLCCLEGLSLEEAGRQLGRGVGAVKGRLERGRARLRQRLERRGLTLPGAMAALMLGGRPPAALVDAALTAVHGEATASVLALAEGGQALGTTKLAAVAVTLLCGMLAAGALPRGGPKEAAAPPPEAKGDPFPGGARARLGATERRAVEAAIAVTSDGRSIVAVSRDGKLVTEWDFRTGKLRGRRSLPALSYGPHELSADGHWLATYEYPRDGKGEPWLVVWDLRTGKKARRLTAKTADSAPTFRFSPDGRRLAVVTYEDRKPRLQVWEWQRGESLLRDRVEARELCQHLSFSPDGNRVLLNISPPRRDNLFCWDVVAGRRAWAVEVSYVKQLLVTPKGKVLLFGHAKTVQERDLGTGAVTTSLRLPGVDGYHHLALTAMGDRLLESRQERVVVWDLATGASVAAIPVGWSQLAPGPDGRSVVTNNGYVQRWDLVTGKPLFPDDTSPGHLDEVTAVRFVAGGKRLVSAANDGSVAVWNVAVGGGPVHHWRGHTGRKPSPRLLGSYDNGGVEALGATDDGRLVISAGYLDRPRVWDAATGKEANSLARPEQLDASYPERVHSLHLVDGGRAALALLCQGSRGPGTERTGRLVRWDLATGRPTVVSPVDRLLYSTSAVDPTGRLAVNAGRVLSARNGQAVAALQGYDPAGAPDATFSPDGLLVAGGPTWKADHSRPTLKGAWPCVWEAVTGRLVARLPGKGRSGEKVFHPDGRHLAASFWDAVLVWDMCSGKEVMRWPPSAAAQRYAHVSCFAFSPDGKTLATGHSDGTILLWDADLPVPHVEPIRPGELDKLWRDLGGDGTPKAYQAAWRLAELPSEAVPFLRERVKPVTAIPVETARALIADLDADSKALREKAFADLQKVGQRVEQTMREALKAPASAEQKRRLGQLLAGLDRPVALTADQVRDLRGVLVLSWLDTTESTKTLRTLSEGVVSDPVTQQAKAGLARRLRSKTRP